MAEKYTERELEQLIRRGLAERAEGAADSLKEPLPTRSPRPRAWLAAAAVAAAVVVGVPLAWQFVSSDDQRQGSEDEVAVDAADPPGWRTESYGGVQVRVPADWGWGGAPMVDGVDGNVLDCGVAAFVVPGSTAYEDVPSDTPYVGRPVMMTDACTVIDPKNAPAQWPPTTDSVWLGAPVDAGTVNLDNGYVRETLQLGAAMPSGGGTVTVTTDDPELRARILATVKLVEVDDNGCAADGNWAEVPAGPLDEVEPDSLSVCAYETVGHRATLIWSSRRDAAAASAYVENLEQSSSTYDPIRYCTEPPEGQWLAIGVNGNGAKTAWTAVVMGKCAQIQWHYRAQGDPEALAGSPVIPRTVQPWGGSEARAYLVGPSGWEEYAGKDGEAMFRGFLG